MTRTATITISFGGFRNINLGNSSDIGNDSGSANVYWLSIPFRGETMKSEQFHADATSSEFKSSSVTFAGVSSDEIQSEIFKPLKIFLCSEKAIIAVMGINPIPSTIFKFGDFGSLNSTNWVNMMSCHDPTSGPVAAVNVAIHAVEDSAEEKEGGGEEEEEEEYGEDEDFENEVSHKVATVPENDLDQNQEEDLKLRHVRMSVEVRSIGGLKRPSHVSLHFMYPHMGVSSPVRSNPLWIVPNSETKIDGAAASYDFTMTRQKLQTVLDAHPLTVTAMSKSHLGNNIMGTVQVNLAATNNSSPHSFRCPLTLKVFKTRDEYARHRATMLTEMHAGRREQAPPKDPVIIRVTDNYLSIIPASSAGDTGLEDPSRKSAGSYYTPPHVVEGAKMRVITIFEEIGAVGPETAHMVKPGYKMQNGALYTETVDGGLGGVGYFTDGDAVMPRNPMSRQDLTPQQKHQLEELQLDWEAWRRTVEKQWREALRDKESQLKTKLEAEAAAQLLDRTEELRKAQEETAKLEVRLRNGIDAVERQKMQLTLKEEQMQMKLAQKTSELQLLQRRVRDEAKILVDTEKRNAATLAGQVKSLQDSLKLMQKRCQDVERDFDQYREHTRKTPEAKLRDEVATLRAQLGETRAEIERERRMKAEADVEREQYRSQVHRLALALKKEREKSNVVARQEMEQLRLEFLAREERYILDGDRDELKNIRNELLLLKASNFTPPMMQGADHSTYLRQPPHGQEYPPFPPTHHNQPQHNSHQQQSQPQPQQQQQHYQQSQPHQSLMSMSTPFYASVREIRSSSSGGGSGDGGGGGSSSMLRSQQLTQQQEPAGESKSHTPPRGGGGLGDSGARSKHNISSSSNSNSNSSSSSSSSSRSSSSSGSTRGRFVDPDRNDMAPLLLEQDHLQSILRNTHNKSQNSAHDILLSSRQHETINTSGSISGASDVTAPTPRKALVTAPMPTPLGQDLQNKADSIQRLKLDINDLIGSGSYGEEDEVIVHLRKNLVEAERSFMTLTQQGTVGKL